MNVGFGSQAACQHHIRRAAGSGGKAAARKPNFQGTQSERLLSPKAVAQITEKPAK
jgi:hypothetical protein